MNYTILTDSCCDLPIEYLESNDIRHISLTYRLGDKEFYDNFGQDLEYKKFYDFMREGKLPKTSQVNPQSYYEMFKEILDEGRDILYVCVSSGLSGTYNSANIAKDMIMDEEKYRNRKIEIIDVLTASLGQGLMVIKAVDMKCNGFTLEENSKALEKMKFNLNTYMSVNDLDYLKKGGRISNAAAFVGKLLNIKPLLTLDNEGKVIPILKIKGKKALLKKLAEIISKKMKNTSEEIVCISHGDSIEEAEKLKDIILKNTEVKEVIISNIGPAVGTYGGPGALAIFFIGEHRQNHIIDI
ncbi:DegV family protein [Clostridium botulinum]|uniref:DegV family protein n=1 Tax=Clostridium botulinum TaxID=1491 RepID=UPI0004D7A3B2|nr:DegV family protein [Clostridium botulinum]KEH92033.1 hypothetical protein Z963_07160 [Clostridium botulinum C/D str. It1]